MDKFFKNKLYTTERGTTFIILAQDFEHHKGYTEYLIKLITNKGCFNSYIMQTEKAFWIRSGQLLAFKVSILSESKAIGILYGEEK